MCNGRRLEYKVCLEENLVIVEFENQKDLLNRKSDLMVRCHHLYQFLLFVLYLINYKNKINFKKLRYRKTVNDNWKSYSMLSRLLLLEVSKMYEQCVSYHSKWMAKKWQHWLVVGSDWLMSEKIKIKSKVIS